VLEFCASNELES